MSFDPNDFEVIHSPSSDLEVVAPPAQRDFSFNPSDFEIVSQPKPFLPAVMGPPDATQVPSGRISPSNNPEQWAREKAVLDQQWAAHKQWNDEHGITTIEPLVGPDVAAGRAIQATVRPIQAGIQDLAETAAGRPTMRNMVAVSDNPPGAPTPFEEDTKDVTGYAKHLKNLSQAVPDVAVRAALAGVAGPVAGRLAAPVAFGLQPEGFDPKSAAVIAAFGIGSSIAGELGASLVKKGLLAEGSTLTQKVIEMAGGQLAGDIASLTADLPELMKLSPEERKQRIIDTVIGNAAFLILDVPHLKGSVKSHAQQELAKDTEWMSDKIQAHLDTQWAQQKATVLANPAARNDPNVVAGTRLQRTAEAPAQPEGAPAVFRSGPFPGPEFEPQPQEANAPHPIQQPPGGVIEHPGISPGQNVPANAVEIRQEARTETSGGRGVVGPAEVPAQSDVEGWSFNPIGIKLDGIPPELASQIHQQWEFTDRRKGSPTEGITFYVPEGASLDVIKARIKSKTADFEQATAPVPTHWTVFKDGEPHGVFANERQARMVASGLSGNVEVKPSNLTELQAEQERQQKIIPLNPENATLTSADKTETIVEPKASPPQWLKVSDLTLSKDVPNFKEGADHLTGIVEGEQLKGKWDPTGVGPILVWQRVNGAMEVISGRHRLDLARRNGAGEILAQVLREADGFTKQHALVMDAELNIKDEKGSVKDYANYFRNYKNLSNAEAESRGLLSRAKGITGWIIGRDASDDLFALYAGGKIDERAAVAIARAAPGEADYQRVGIRATLDGATPDSIRGRIEAARSAARSTSNQTDLFADTSLDETWKKQAEIVGRKRRELADIISTRNAVVKRYATATSTGSITADKARAQAELTAATNELHRWESWWLHPDLKTEVENNGQTKAKESAPVPEPAKPAVTPLTLDKPESVDEQQARLDAEAAAQKKKEVAATVGERAAKPLIGTQGDIGQGDLLGGGDLFAQPKPANSVEDIIKLAKDKQGHQGNLDLQETVKSRPELTARGLEELRAALDHPDSGIPEAAKQVIRALLDKPVMRELDWSKLTVSLTDRIAGGFRGVAEQSLSLITLSREAMTPETFPHEVAHFLYELLPERYRQAVEHWRLAAIQKRLNDFRESMGELPPEVRDVFHSIVSGETSDGFMAKLDAVRSAIGEDAFDLLYKMYPMINGSEFLAGFVGNKFASDAFLARNKPRLVDRVKAKLQDWWDGLIETVRGVVGQDPSMNKVYNDLLDGKYLNTPKGGQGFERNLSPGEPKKKPEGFEPTQIMGELEYVRSREHWSPESREQSLKVAEDMFRAAGLPVTAAPELGGWKIVDDGFDRNLEARKLADALEREIATEHEAGKSPDRLASMLNSIVLNFETGGLDHFDRGTRERLFNLSQSERSFRGAALGALAHFGKSVEFVARNVDVVLQRIYSDAFGGPGIKSFMDRLVTSFRNYFTEAEIADALAGRPEFEETLKRMQALNRQDEGGRVYRRVQGLLKPKGTKKLAALEADARVTEAVDKIIEDANKQGIEPVKSPTKPLSPLNRLIHMMTPENAKKIDGLIAQAVADAEHNAGVKAALKEAGGDAARRDLEERFAAGEVPDPEMVEKGLLLPEFAHWKAIRDTLLDYSPTTVKLVQDLIKGDFKGTKFGKAKAPVADTRIDLGKLAKSPEEEVRRVLDAHMANIEAGMNLTGADGATKNRVRGMIERNVADQIAARRKDVLESFFNPKKAAATLPSDRLKQLINAGVEQDPRFQTDRVRQLVKKIASKYLVGEDMDALARSTRTEKTDWWNRKTAEIVAAEGFHDDYLEAVVRTHLAERLQAAEEGVTRGFLKGNDVVYDREPTTPEQRAKSLEDAKSKLEGIIHAGGIDASMVEWVAGKSAVAKLTPKMGDLVKQIFETPFYRQSELRENFADVMVKQLGIDPAQVDKAWEMFGQAFDQKQAVAKKKAFEQAKATLGDHLEERQSFGEGRSVWEIVERAVNAGVFDSGEVLREIAKKRGMTPPTDAEVAKMKALSEEEQRLRDLTPEERAELSPSEIEIELKRKADITSGARARLKTEMAVMWADLSRPIKWMWQEGYKHNRRNLAAAANEMSAANLLFKIGFATRQMIGVGSQALIYTPTRAIGQAFTLYFEAGKRGESSNLLREVGTQLKDAYKIRAASARETFYAIRASLAGRAEERNVERLMSGIAILDRISAKADRYSEQGNHGLATVYRLLALQKLGFRGAQALDSMQGVPAANQELRYLVKKELRDNGKTQAEAEVSADYVIGDMKAQFLMAVDDIQSRLNAGSIQGWTPKIGEIKEQAWNLVRRWQFERVQSLELPSDDFEKRIELLRNTIGYNEREVSGLGGAVASGIKSISHEAEGIGVPLLFGRFGNAIGITINRGMAFTPFYLVDMLSPHGSGWRATETDRMQRHIEGIGGSVIGSIAIGLVLSGAIRVFSKPPSNESDRELWLRQGHRAGTVEIPVPGGFVALSLNNSPITPLAPYLAGAGALSDLLQKREKQQQALNEKAAKLGVAASKIRPLDFSDMMGVAVAAGYQTIMGGRTASGLIGSMTEQGMPNVTKSAASQISGFIPGLPALQEVSRMMGVTLDTKMASFWDFLLPLPTSAARKVNMLGDPVGTPDALQRITQVLTGGSYPYVSSDAASETGYASLFSSGYRPPSINPGRGYNVNGEMRPLNDAELEKFTVARGELFKQKLAAIGPTTDKKVVKAAFGAATAEALKTVGATGTTGGAAAAPGPAAGAASAVRARTGRSVVGRGRAGTSSRLRRGGNSAFSRIGKIRPIAQPRLSRR